MDVGQGPPVTPSPSTDSAAFPLAVVGLLCFAGAELAALAAIDVGGTVVPPVWPASGLLLGALLLTPRGRWLPAVAVAWLAMAVSLLLHDHGVAGSLALAVLYAAEGVLAALVVMRLVDGAIDLSRPAHLFALAGAALAMPLAGGLLVALVPPTPRLGPFGELWLTFWLAGGMGLFFGALLVLGWREWRHAPRAQRANLIELGLVLVTGALLAEAVYGERSPDVMRTPSYVLPVLLWAVFRLGPGGTATAMFTVVMIGLLLGASPGAAQDTALRDELLRDWRDMQQTLRRLADEMPDAAFDFRATEPQRTFAQQVQHVATANLLNLGFLGDDLPAPVVDRADLSRAGVMAAMDASFAHGAAVLARHDDAWLMEIVETNAFLGPSSRARVAWFLLGHSWDIYGQMAVYLRLNGGTPPASQRP